MAPFITPMATKYDPNAAVSNAVQARGISLHDQQTKDALAENKRQFNEELPLKQFTTFGNQYNQNREYDEREQERATKLMSWVKDQVEQDPEKAQAMAPFIKGILDIHGIQMHLPGEAPQPGQAPFEQPKPPSEGEQAIGNIAAMEQAPAPTTQAPGFGGSEEASQRELEQAQIASRGAEAQPKEEPLPTETHLPGESLSAYFSRALAPQVPKQKAALPPQAQPQALPGAAPEAGAEGEPPAKWDFSYRGKPIGSIDVYRQADINARRTQGMAQGYMTGAMPKADVPFIKGIMEPILSGAIRTPEDLQAYIKNVVEPELSRRSKERSSFAMAASKSQGPTLSGVSTVNDDLQAIQEHFATRYNVNKIHERQDAANRAMDLLESGDPIAQRDAFTAHLKAMFSSVTSDKELGFAQDAAGKLERIKMSFNSWFGGGELPENYRTLLSEANQILSDQTQHELEEIGKRAGEYIKRIPTLSLDVEGRKQAAGTVAGYFSGKFDVPEIGGPMGVSGMKGGGKTGSSGSEKGSRAATEMAVPPKTKKILEAEPQ